MTDPIPVTSSGGATPPSGRTSKAGDGARRGNGRTLAKLVVAACVMFGFGYAMIPIYKSICELTGVNSLTKRDEDADTFARNTQVDVTRRITVEFDANSRGDWLFKPERNTIEVHPGELTTVVYELTNTRGQTTVGHAIPSYAPSESSQYFRKIECFCFKQQTLEANETRKFPVVFVLDPNMPKDVNTITLSYTFFEVGGRTPPAPDSRPGTVSGVQGAPAPAKRG